ncbi:hypothetical protein BH20VER1_BH20VER1_19580 [soil metagenome]
MSIEDIRSLKHTAPFRPFNIVMDDGRVVWVSGPERIALSPSGKTVAVYEGSAVSFFALRRMQALQPDAAPPMRFKQKPQE